jgi:UDP-N-acetyl-2-amino-2-deoxyglucuronate dehydrogenase
MSGKIRIGLVGCGGIASAHLEAYEMLRARGCEHFEITAVFDLSPQAMEKAAGRIAQFQPLSPQPFQSLEALIASGRVDGVDICTPHADHHVSVVKCLEAGIHVLVEKPLGVTVRAAKRIVEAAGRTGRILSVAENSRRGLGQRAITWLFNTHKLIGDPRLFAIEYLTGPKLPLEPARPAEINARVDWRADKLQAGGGWAYDGGVHLMDSLLVYFGEIESLHARQQTLSAREVLLADGNRLPDRREDLSVITFQFKNGMTGSWIYGFSLPGADFMRVAFYCAKGWVLDQTAGGWTHTFGGGFIPSDATIYLPDGKTLHSRDLELEYLLSLGEPERERLFPHGVQRSVAQECHEFIDCIRENRTPEVDAKAGLDGLAVAAAVYESALLGQAVKIEDVRSSRIDAFQREVDQHWGLI